MYHLSLSAFCSASELQFCHPHYKITKSITNHQTFWSILFIIAFFVPPHTCQSNTDSQQIIVTEGYTAKPPAAFIEAQKAMILDYLGLDAPPPRPTDSSSRIKKKLVDASKLLVDALKGLQAKNVSKRFADESGLSKTNSGAGTKQSSLEGLEDQKSRIGEEIEAKLMKRSLTEVIDRLRQRLKKEQFSLSHQVQKTRE